jgi:hypothetical protein
MKWCYLLLLPVLFTTCSSLDDKPKLDYVMADPSAAGKLWQAFSSFRIGSSKIEEYDMVTGTTTRTLKHTLGYLYGMYISRNFIMLYSGGNIIYLYNKKDLSLYCGPENMGKLINDTTKKFISVYYIYPETSEKVPNGFKGEHAIRLTDDRNNNYYFNLEHELIFDSDNPNVISYPNLNEFTAEEKNRRMQESKIAFDKPHLDRLQEINQSIAGQHRELFTKPNKGQNLKQLYFRTIRVASNKEYYVFYFRENLAVNAPPYLAAINAQGQLVWKQPLEQLIDKAAMKWGNQNAMSVSTPGGSMGNSYILNDKLYLVHQYNTSYKRFGSHRSTSESQLFTAILDIKTGKKIVSHSTYPTSITAKKE